MMAQVTLPLTPAPTLTPAPNLTLTLTPTLAKVEQQSDEIEMLHRQVS